MKVVQFGEGAPPGGPPGSQPGEQVGGAIGWRAVTRVLRSCAALAQHLGDDAVTTVFPSDCSVCGGPMTAWSAAPVCSACVERVGPQRGALCPICGEALGMESARFAASMGASACTMCRLAPPAFSRAVAYSEYADELREMLHLLKYEHVVQIAAGQLGQWMAEAVLMLAGQASTDLTVIAVPLFPARQRQRGFNQSALLADAAIARLKKLRPSWQLSTRHAALARIRDTEAQFGLTPRARRRNLRGAFRVVDIEAVRGREVLLVDDIMTTGATARECARVLFRAGAAKVWVATLARAQAESFVATQPESGAVAMWDAPLNPGIVHPDPGRRLSF